MTRTKEQLRKAIFAKLKGLRRKLHGLGVPSTYTRSELRNTQGEISFTITCRVADDQATVLPRISVRTAEGVETLDHLPLDQGIIRLKELFHAKGDANGQADTQAGNA
jgi:hypothetical protein